MASLMPLVLAATRSGLQVEQTTTLSVSPYSITTEMERVKVACLFDVEITSQVLWSGMVSVMVATAVKTWGEPVGA